MSFALEALAASVLSLCFIGGVVGMGVLAYDKVRALPKLDDPSVYSVIVNGQEALEFKFPTGQQFLMPTEAVAWMLGLAPAEPEGQHTDCVSNTTMGFVDFENDEDEARKRKA